MKFRIARRTGPTRPHPRGPDRPLALATKGALAALLDHIRDLHSRARRHPLGFERPDLTDAVGVVAREHSRIAQLLTQVECHRDPDDTLVRRVIGELSIHDSIERQYLYPLVQRRLQDGAERVEHLVSEHTRIVRLASDLDVYRFHDEARASWLHQLVSAVRPHMEQEEAEVLPALAARMTREELVDLGVLLESARAKAPTRPHRHAVATGVGARLSRLLVAPLDKTRDAISGRRAV